MKIKAAVLREANTDWSVEEINLDGPGPREVLVKTSAAGMCHSDEHGRDATMPLPLPVVGGHEGAGVVVELGEGVTELAVGDHVSASFVPSCGRCRWCAEGQQNICDLGMYLMTPAMMPPAGGYRHRDAAGNELTPMLKLGTFAEYMVLSVDSAVKVDPDVPAEIAAMVSCGVTTGYGSVVDRARTSPGDTVVVVGCGGLGVAALQAARLAGAANVVAVDPVEFKRESASRFGATHTAESMEAATETVRAITLGVMADSVVLTTSTMTGDLLLPAQFLTRKGGSIVVTAVAPVNQMDAQVNLFEFAMTNKQILGSLFGSASPRSQIPHLLSLYSAGQLDLDSMVTTTYTLDEVNKGYRDLLDGKNIRGVILFDQ